MSAAAGAVPVPATPEEPGLQLQNVGRADALAFMYYPFSLHDTARVVSDTRAFMVGHRVQTLCEEKMLALAAERKAAPSRAPLADQDCWGRNRALRVDNTSMMFLDAAHDGARSPNIKTQLDKTLGRVCMRDVLLREERSEQLAAMFFSRAQLALQHYCIMRGWTYGPDLLLVCTGGGCATQFYDSLLPPLPQQQLQAYEVLVRNLCEGTRNHVTKLLAYVLYAVELIMRTQSARWRPDARAFEGASLLQELREIHPDIDSVRPADKPHSDIGIYPVRNPYVEDQRGVVMKNSASLVVPLAHDGTPQQRRGLDVMALRRTLPFLPLYVSRTEPAHPGDTTRLRLIYDFVLQHHNQMAEGEEGDGIAPAPSILHSAACVLSVDVLGPADWRRAFLLECVRTDAYSALVTLPPVRGVTLLTWPPLLAWQGAMQGFFEWVHLNAAGGGWRHRIDAVMARDKATRMLWWTALVHLLRPGVDAPGRTASAGGMGRGKKKKTWTPVPEMSTGGARAAGREASGPAKKRRTLSMLLDLQMAVSVPDGVEVSSMPGALDAPFDEVWRAAQATLATSLDTSEKRDAFKETLCHSLVSLSTELHASLGST